MLIWPIRYRMTSFAVTPGPSFPSTRSSSVFGFRLQQRLRREHVFDFARADAERQCTERAMRRSVAIAADDRHAGLRVALLGADDVHDPLPRIVNVVQRDSEFVAVVAQRIDLLLRDRVENRQAAIGRRHVVIDRRQRQLGPAHRATRQTQALKRLRAGDFVNQVQIDVQNRLPARFVVNDVLVPDFLE